MFFLVASFLFTFLPFTTSQCFGLSGTKYSTDQACDTGSTPTFCCSASATCLSIGLCKKNGRLITSTCSDPSFSGTCSKYCPEAGAFVTSCDSEGTYCCSTGDTVNKKDKCCSGDETFLLKAGDFSTLQYTSLPASTSKQGSSTAKSTLKATSSSGTAKTTGKSSTGSSSAETSSTAHSTSTDLAASTAAQSNQGPSTITSTQTSTPSATAAPVVSGLSSGAKIGIGVGSALGFAFLGFSVFAIVFLLRRRRQDKINAIRLSGLRAKAETSRSFSNNSGYAGVVGEEGSRRQQEHVNRFPNPPIYTQQHTIPLPYQPREITSIPESEHLLTPEPNAFENVMRGPPIVTSVPLPTQRQVYRAYQPPAPIDNNELGFPHVRTNSGPSFSELVTPTSTAPAQSPVFRAMTPAQELAAARARSNMTPAASNAQNLSMNVASGEGLRRQDSFVSEISGRSGRDRDSNREALTRGNSVVSGRTEYRASRQEH